MRKEKLISIWANSLLLSQEGKTKEEKKATIKNLAKILKKQKKDYLLPVILERVEKTNLKRKKIELIFAREQTDDLIKKMKQRLLEIFGLDRIIEIQIDREIIGGFRIKTKNFLIKASIKDFLEMLKMSYESI